MTKRRPVYMSAADIKIRRMKIALIVLGILCALMAGTLAFIFSVYMLIPKIVL